jgi:hypothetical protein
MEINDSKIIEIYQNLANTVDNEIVVESGNDFSCCIIDKNISIPLLADIRETENFLKSIAKITKHNIKYNCVNKIDSNLISFLHEIGHIQTDQQDLISNIGRKLANFIYKYSKTVGAFIYYNLPEEKRASKWAVDYISTHYAKVKAFQVVLRNKYNKFYSDLLNDTIDI